MRLRRPIAFILSAAVAASALTGCDSFSGHAAAAANSAQVQQLIEFIADLGLERDLRQALQKGGDLRQALLTLLGLENAVNFNVDDLTGARPGQHAVQVWEVTAQSAEDAAALAASQIRAVLEQLKSNGVTEGRIGMVEVNGKYYVVVDVEVTEENTFEPIRPVSDDDDDSEDTPSVPAPTATVGDMTIDLSSLGTDITAESILKLAGKNSSDKDSITELDLSNCAGLQNIDNQAFQHCDKLVSVTLPDGLQSIGNSAFYECTSLTNINLPEGLQSIGNSAFADCKSLETVTLPSTVTTIAGSAFYNCSGLKEIDLNGCTKLTTIGDLAFQNCTSLKEINLNGCTSLERIDNGAFASSGLTEIDLSGCESLERIGNSAFWGCNSLTSIDLCNTRVTTIDTAAFRGCTKLGTVLLPESLTTIGSKAFYNCTDLQSIYFQSVPGIANNAFFGVNAEGLTVYYPSSWDSADNNSLNILKQRLGDGSLDINEVENYPTFEPDTEFAPLTYLLGL